jgi:hypothetical protein
VPWFYGNGCNTCATFDSDSWTAPRPMESYSDNLPDLFGNLDVDNCGGDSFETSNG